MSMATVLRVLRVERCRTPKSRKPMSRFSVLVLLSAQDHAVSRSRTGCLALARRGGSHSLCFYRFGREFVVGLPAEGQRGALRSPRPLTAWVGAPAMRRSFKGR